MTVDKRDARSHVDTLIDAPSAYALQESTNMDIPDLASIFNDDQEEHPPAAMQQADSLPEPLKLNFDPFLLQGEVQLLFLVPLLQTRSKSRDEYWNCQ